MTSIRNKHMDEILALTKAGDLAGATSLIQRSLGMATTANVPMKHARTVRPAPLTAPRLPSPARKGASQTANFAGEGRMQRHRFSSRHGKLDYLLYVPTSFDSPAPLVVMLHGCTQSAADFARGTQMNAVLAFLLSGCLFAHIDFPSLFFVPQQES